MLQFTRAFIVLFPFFLGLLSLSQVQGQDTDLDGIIDLVDLDDDNDGIPDSTEFPCTRFDYTFNGLLDPADGQTLTTETGIQVQLDFQELGPPGTIVRQAVLPGDEIFFENDFTDVSETNQLEITFAPVLTNAYLQFTDFDQSFGGAYGETWTLQMFNGAVEVPFIILNMGANLQQNGNTFAAFQGGNTFNDPENTLLIVLTENITRMVITGGAVSLNGGTDPPLFGTNIYLGSCGRDSDGDGVLDHIDLDSDNDGVYDVIEAGHCLPHANGVLTGGVDAFGIPNPVSNGLGGVNYAIANRDIDGFIDAIDSDSDGDLCVDSQEAGVSDEDGDGIAGLGLPSINALGMVEGIVYGEPTNPFDFQLDTLVCEPISLTPLDFLMYPCLNSNITWEIGGNVVAQSDPGNLPFDAITPIYVYSESYCETFVDSGIVAVYGAEAGNVSVRDPSFGEDTLRVCETTEPVEVFSTVPGGEWSINGVSTGNGTIDSLFLFDSESYEPGVYGLKYTVVTPQGCVDSATLAAKISPNPEAFFVPELFESCAPTPNILFTNLSEGNSPLASNWTFQGQTTTTNDLNTGFDQPGSYVVALVVETEDNCVDSHEETLTVYPQPNAEMLFPDVPRCSPMFVPFDLVPSTYTDILWYVNGEVEERDESFGHAFIDTIPEHEVILELSYENVCFDRDTAFFYPLPEIISDFQLDDYQLGADTVKFENLSLNADEFQWNFGGATWSGNSSTEIDPAISYLTPGNYQVTLVAENAGNCLDTSFLEVAFFPIGKLFIPNAFSPNADGVNDVIHIIATYPPKLFEWHIYDRWGRSIATMEDIGQSWDGTLPNGTQAPEGV
ncbi:MAG: PKD domain-containing protein, partial [Bacteroidota bacterium]